MDRKNIGFKLIIPEGEKLTSVKMSNKAFEQVKQLFGKTPNEYISEFINDEKLENDLFNELDRCIKNAIPKDLDCEFCKSKDPKEGEKACDRYTLQMNITYNLVASEFIRIVNYNMHLFEDKKYLRRLTGHFFSCFTFYEGLGQISFDLDKLSKLIVSEGFLALNEVFMKSDTLTNLKITNNTLNELELEHTNLQIFEEEDVDLIGVQKDFFEAKKDYFQTNLLIEKEEKAKQIKTTKSIEGRPNRTDIALYAYYLNVTKYPVSESSFPSVASWKEIGAFFEKNPKNIQQVYNKIIKSENRLKKSNSINIEFIIKKLLDKYPKALDLAKDELRIIETKS